MAGEPVAPPATKLAGPERAYPDERVVLTLKWQDGRKKPITLSLAALEHHPWQAIRTGLPSSLNAGGASTWEGVSLRHLLSLIGKPAAVRLSALNGYTVTVPASDLERYDPVLAFRRDGELISIRDKGPLILIYPFDNSPELRTQVYLSRTIWQVNEIIVE